MISSLSVLHHLEYPKRFTELSREEKGEGGDRGHGEGEQRKRRVKRGESNLAGKQFPMCSPQSGTLREVHGVTQRREEGGRR